MSVSVRVNTGSDYGASHHYFIIFIRIDATYNPAATIFMSMKI